MKHIITDSKYAKYYGTGIGDSPYYWSRARHSIDEKLIENKTKNNE